MAGQSHDSRPSTILSRRDLDFLLHEWLDTAGLVERSAYDDHDLETVDAVLDLAGTLATEKFAPHNRAADLTEPTFDGERVHLVPEVAPALAAFTDAGFLAAPLPERVGGAGLPQSVYSACMAWFHAANVGTTGYALLTLAAANLLTRFGDEELVQRFVPAMTRGECFGTMALSEPQSGSNLADITTRAEPADDGTYRLFGRKMWISGGDHELSDNIVHLVLARTPDAPAGTKGISLFAVPKFVVDADGAPGERNDVVLAGINHKMGFRGTVNTAPVLGEGAHTPGGRAGAVGHLVGELHRGLPVMFAMMNEARIGVGLGAASLGYTGYLTSLAYARDRLQGRHVGAAPTEPQVTLTEHADVRRMLLAQKAYAEGGLALVLLCSRLVDDAASLPDDRERAEAEQLLGLLTPVAKSWPSQWCLAANDLAIQVMGGAGYTRDHPVEQFYRDNRLNPIHEGSHGIQAIDLLGRKVLGDGGAALAALGARVARTAERASAAGGEGEAYAAALLRAVGTLTDAVERVGTQTDPRIALAEATAFLEATGHVVVAWVWLEQWLAAADRDGAFYDGKRAATAYFLTRELPKVDVMLARLIDPDTLLTDLDPDVL
ncbi:acyl-CoA dehydrogenase [Nocardioidaceae bacterium]|nr:acyl-CoA dehydrogenase [Nocardioidaceae bacterium]